LTLKSPYPIYVQNLLHFDLVSSYSDGPITQGALTFAIPPNTCIGDYKLGDTLNSGNAYWDGVNWQPCVPFQVTAFNSANTRIHQGEYVTNNLGVDTNSPASIASRIGNPDGLFDFYATIRRGDTEFLQKPIAVRVTPPIIANSAGGAGYFNTPSLGSADTYVSINTITQSFLEQLKVANFNTAKVQDNRLSSDFDLKNIA
jgi:hypothetical protein